jgi:hypothetical protein
MPRPLLHVTWIMSRAALVPAAREAAALYLGVAVVASVLFAPQGMTASDAVAALAGARPVRLGFWLAWIVAATPAARSLFTAPGLFYLRALPTPRLLQLGLHAAYLFLLETPLIVLHARGAGPIAGAAAGVAAAAAHSLLVAPRVRPVEGAGALALLAALAWPVPWAALLGIGVLVLVAAVPIAWRRAPELGARRRRRAVGGPAPIALALAYVASVRRSQPAAQLRLVAIAVAGGALAALAARNNETSALPLVLGVGGATLPLALGALISEIVAVERRGRWLLVTSGAQRPVQLAGALLAASAWGLLGGLLHGVAAAWMTTTTGHATLLVTLSAAWGAALAIPSLALARRARDGGTAFALAAAVSLGGGMAAAFLGVLALPAVLGAGLLAAAIPSEVPS